MNCESTKKEREGKKRKKPTKRERRSATRRKGECEAGRHSKWQNKLEAICVIWPLTCSLSRKQRETSKKSRKIWQRLKPHTPKLKKVGELSEKSDPNMHFVESPAALAPPEVHMDMVAQKQHKAKRVAAASQPVPDDDDDSSE